jgi:DNA-binding transcriptional ArsR family regulator
MSIPAPTPGAASLDEIADQLKVLAHPARLRIVQYLHRPTTRRQSVTDIYQALDLSQAITSQHLLLLKDRGILASEKIGTKIYYAIAAKSWCVQVVGIIFKQVQQ